MSNNPFTTPGSGIVFSTYQVTGSPSWCYPGQLVYVIDNLMVGGQSHPKNGLTRWWAEDGEEEVFNPANYSQCQLIQPGEFTICDSSGSVYSLV